MAGVPDDPPGAGPAVGPGTAQAAATAWVEAVMDRGDLATAWALTDPTLRLVLAQDWVWEHRHDAVVGDHEDWDALADALSDSPSQHWLWDSFASELVTRWHTIWKGFSTKTWGAWDEPEVVGLDLEMVTFVETRGRPVAVAPRRATFSRRFLARHTETGWVVAGINGDQVFRPGWPPSPAK